MVAGRGTEGRTVTIVTTNSSTSVTAAAGVFDYEDVGRTVTGTGIAANTVISAVSSDTAAALSIAATATGSRSVVLGAGDPAGYGYTGWSPESSTENRLYTVPNGGGSTAPFHATNSYTSIHQQRARG
jgi:precorrin-6B methylase 1